MDEILVRHGGSGSLAGFWAARARMRGVRVMTDQPGKFATRHCARPRDAGAAAFERNLAAIKASVARHGGNANGERKLLEDYEAERERARGRRTFL